jgi:hypothetical protein
LKPPGFNPSAHEVKNWFQILLSNPTCTTYSTARGERAVERPADVIRVPTAAASTAAAAGRPPPATTAAASNNAAAAAAAPELLTEIPKGATAKETLQMAMAAREKYDAQLKGAVQAAQEVGLYKSNSVYPAPGFSTLETET